MLLSRTVPQFGEKPEDWQRFLYKASIGSVKAYDMLSSADLAYMVDLTGDSESPSTLNLDEYGVLFRDSFPKTVPFESPQDIVDYGARLGWFPHSIQVTHSIRNDVSHYQAVWSSSKKIDWTALANDAILTCFESWDATFALGCIDLDGSCDYNSRAAVTGMIFLSLTWPRTTNNEQSIDLNT